MKLLGTKFHTLIKKISAKEEILLSIWIVFSTFEKRKIFNLEAATIDGLVNEWLTISLYASDIIGLLILTLFLLSQHKNIIKSVSKFKTKTYIILYFGLLISTTINTPNFSRSLYLAVSISLLVFILWRIYTQLKNHKYHLILLSIILTGVTQSTIAIVQFHTQHSIGLKLLGEIEISKEVTNIGKIVSEGETYIRAVGTFTHSNALSIFLTFTTIILFIYLAQIHKNKSQYHLILFALILINYAQILTFSRVGYFITAITFLYFIYTFRKNHRIVIGISISIISIALLAIPHVNQIVPRGTIADQNGDMAISIRKTLTTEAVKQITQRPLSGTGLGQFVPTYMNNNPTLQNWEYQPVHNIPLLIISELGIIISGCILIIIAKNIHKKNQYTLILSIFLLVPSFFDHHFLTLHQTQAIAGLAMVLIFSIVPRGTIETKTNS